jgi:hypothetical protein
LVMVSLKFILSKFQLATFLFIIHCVQCVTCTIYEICLCFHFYFIFALKSNKKHNHGLCIYYLDSLVANVHVLVYHHNFGYKNNNF